MGPHPTEKQRSPKQKQNQTKESMTLETETNQQAINTTQPPNKNRNKKHEK
jgi:hypothetical protein